MKNITIDIIRKLLLLMLLFSPSFSLLAQETVVVGQVLSAEDKLPIPDVNIYFKNTSIGTKSDDEGYFMLRTFEKVKTVIFSNIAYETETIKLKPGQSIGLQMEMHEKSTELMDIIVIPGANPAIEFMRKVRLAKKRNDISSNPAYKSLMTGQDVVLLDKLNQRSLRKRIFQQLSKGSLNSEDSTLTIPLFMSENKYQITKGAKNRIARNVFSSEERSEQLLLSLTGDMDGMFNFYRSSISLFGKSFVSPLAKVGNAYYRFYITDSLKHEERKEYQITFRSKNAKDLAFNGQMYIDSASLALIRIEAELSKRANINYVNQLKIAQQYKYNTQKYWELDDELLTVRMTYDLLADSLRTQPELFISKRMKLQTSNVEKTANEVGFAGSEYDRHTIDEKMQNLGETKLVNAAKWLTGVIITAYIPVGKVDIGKIQNLMRVTDIEGFRINLPMRTNETFSKYFGVSGYAGYGFRNKEVKYSAATLFSLPIPTRNVFKVSYTDDYRRIDYDYNDFMLRENPLLSGDEDISNTIFGFRSSGKLNERKEFSASASFDISDNIESSLIYRSNDLYSNNIVPFVQHSIAQSSISQQSMTLVGRFSKNERVYDDHFNRIYVGNSNPVLYAILEGGKYNVGVKNEQYFKASAILKQELKFDLGQWNYVIEAGKIFGDVPYILLEVPKGSETMIYKRYNYSLMNYMEYASDQYISLHNELIFNGFVFNNIPLIKYLNLREMFSMNVFYGGLDDGHKNILDYPSFMHTANKPYVEVGLGVSNIFRLFTLQSIWRLSGNNHAGVSPWGLRASVRVSF